MKRSVRISLVLLGGLSAGAGLASCSRGTEEGRTSSENVYVNDTYVAGIGYYHAPFRTFYPMPYNHYDAQRRMYYYGGSWGATPHASVINVSAPTPEAAAAVRNAEVSRGGFGGTSHHHSIWS